ncbi:SMI1/KNR4 family protein [Hymenobacter cheonanensis]|uniref:SMI1/KNR4 family protein n=1 Tax=Hymenobacter sp. CA2-7 TaxID=3063993 RepID=UPI0027137C16|nr:SMI1/KNR4 family protein [Hymenobacter sp. CA2-7]MDO7886361.1 SMI1/KNR4 family protein [Hymenobacter sp. CA2-7]
MEEVDFLVAELRRFSPDIAELGTAVNSQLVTQFEREHDFVLPNDYKLTIAQINGFSVMGAEVYGLHGKTSSPSLESVYQREHTDVFYPQPSYLIPFSGDGGGNFYCFDTRFESADEQSSPVVFWVSNYPYTEDDPPVITNDSFLDFVREVIIG